MSTRSCTLLVARRPTDVAGAKASHDEDNARRNTGKRMQRIMLNGSMDHVCDTVNNTGRDSSNLSSRLCL